MSIRRFLTATALMLIVAAVAHPQQQPMRWGNAGGEALVWNQHPNEPLFVTGRLQNQMAAGLGLAYRERDFSVSLLQPLSFSTAGGYFIWWVTVGNQPGERMICFQRESDRLFRASGLVADLHDLGELKEIKTGSGSTFLFAVAGDGQLRLMSAASSTGQHLFIDYTATGQVERIRDDFARDAAPQYQDGTVRQLVQTWSEHGNKYLTAAILK